MTLNPQNKGFNDFFAILGCRRVNCDEMDEDRLRLPANRNCYKLSRVSWALAQIFCFNREDWRTYEDRDAWREFWSLALIQNHPNVEKEGKEKDY